MGLDVGEGRLGRFLHDVAQLAGQDQLGLARHRGGLDEEDLAAGLGPGQAGGHADPVVLGRHLGRKLRGPRSSATTSGVISVRGSFFWVIAVATLRQMEPILRSRLRTPASRV